VTLEGLGYEFVNSERRFRQPVLEGQPTSVALAQRHLREKVSNGTVIGIGSRAHRSKPTLLCVLSWGRNVFTPAWPMTRPRLVGRMLEILWRGAVRTPTLREIEECDAVFILGEDVTNVAPRMALALRSRCANNRWRLPRG
jgi:NADH-quinone oxidoreductase subunit G